MAQQLGKRSRVIAFERTPDSPPNPSSSDAVRITCTNNNAQRLRTTQAHTVTLRPNTRGMRSQTQKSAQSTLAVDASEEDVHPLLNDDTGIGVADEQLDLFEELEDQCESQTEDGPKRPPVRVFF